MDRLYRVSQGRETFYLIDRDGQLHHAAPSGGSIYEGYTLGATLPGLGSFSLRAPAEPSKCICVGLNYRDHAAEMKKVLPADPLLFSKPPSAALDPGGAILLPPGVGRVDHEAELAVVIGKRAHRVSRARAWDYVFGLTCLNDVTARDIQNRETQYTRAKGFDTFMPFGPCIAVGPAPEPRQVEGWVNGECRQRSTTDQLIFPIDMLIEYISFVMTLEPGDIISTGTPAGVGALTAGDRVTVSVEGVGELTNPVHDEQ